MRPIVLFALLFLVSCYKENNEMARYHEDGRAKPVVAIASVTDMTCFDTAWSLSEEFTATLLNQMAQKGLVCPKEKDDVNYAESPFGTDLSWIKREFKGYEFAVFAELIEHQNQPVLKNNPSIPLQEASTNLNMAVRLRVIDLRMETPRVVLQEIIRDSYFIPKTMLPTNYSVVTWGSPNYAKTPMGIAHFQLIQELSNRVIDYILLAKSR